MVNGKEVETLVSPEGDSWVTPEVRLVEGTRAYLMPVFNDDHNNLNLKGPARFLYGGIRKELPIYTPAEVIQNRINAYFRSIEEQGGTILGTHSEPLFNNLGEGIGQARFVIVRK